MIEHGHDHTVMGNHEFNALAFHTRHEGEYLRPRTAKNTKQHQAFLNEFESEPELKQQVLDFFLSLPLCSNSMVYELFMHAGTNSI